MLVGSGEMLSPSTKSFLMLENANYVAQLVCHFILALAGDNKIHCTSVTLVKAATGSHSLLCFPNPEHLTFAQGPSKPSTVSVCGEFPMRFQEFVHLWL